MEKIIDKKLLEHLLDLAKLELEEKEKEKILFDLEKILDYFKQIDEVNLDNIEPFLIAAFQKSIFREDKEIGRELEEIELCLKEAPELEEGGFKVPRVIR